MEEISNLMHGFAVALTLPNLVYMLIGITLGVPVVFFLVFERWFLVPLAKGPIERLLGF